VTTPRALAVALVAAALLAGCGSDDGEDEQTPSVCLRENGLYRDALGTAPGEVAFEDGTPISDCLTPNQSAGDLSRAGELMIQTATELNAIARKDPGGPAAIQLGYLVGAIERGAEGIHADLVRRVNTAARFSPEGLLQAKFERTFGEGYAAGLESG